MRRRAGERPDPSRPEGTDTLPGIEHVVVVMMENHSYDNYLGMLGRGDGFTLGPDGKPTNACPDAGGMPVRAFHMANTCQLPKQPSQAWNATHAQWNNGEMDGFVRSDSGPVAMGYWTGADLPFYYGLATTFPVCDRWFGRAWARPTRTAASSSPPPRRATSPRTPPRSPSSSLRTGRSWSC